MSVYVRNLVINTDEDFSEKAGGVPTRWSRRNKNSAQPPLKPIKQPKVYAEPS